LPQPQALFDVLVDFVDVDAATACLTKEPFALTTYHCFWKPWPLVCPAAVSPAKNYNGKPA
jgi:hypothetical protein